MGLHKIKKGLRLPITGEPAAEIDRGRAPGKVALLADDYVGLRPTMHVQVGSDVRRGQLLFEDKKNPGVRYTSPAAGRVVAIHRGGRRAFRSIVVQLSRSETEGRAGGPDDVSFSSYQGKSPRRLDRAAVKALLLESGQWTALRGRPHSRVASPEDQPSSIFVTVIDSQPLAAAPSQVLAGEASRFTAGLEALAKLTDGSVFVCTDAADEVELPEGEQFRHERFSGPHPAGTVGLHIHRLDPVDRHKIVWHLGYQDVVAIGHLFTTGKLHVQRVVALGGPAAQRPRLLQTRLGASIDDLVEGEIADGEARVVSGSVLSGRVATGEVEGYLGRYHQQVSVLAEGRDREFLGWLAPGTGKFSVINTFVSKLIPGKRFPMTTSTNGSVRAIVPIGMYERVMAMDIMPTPLLRALLMGDVEVAERLGCLELDEEDLALCTFVCPGKNDYGPHLRAVLDTIRKEG